MWNLVFQVINLGSSIADEHAFDDDNMFFMTTTKVKYKVVKDATR